MILAVAASALSLGACAQHKEAPASGSCALLEVIRACVWNNFNQKARSFCGLAFFLSENAAVAVTDGSRTGYLSFRRR